MKIFVFVEIYPIPFKPYYDAQFAKLLEAGHDLTIFAYSSRRRALSEKVREWRLDERTRRYPSTFRDIGGSLTPILTNLLSRPVLAGRAALAAFTTPGSLKHRIVRAARAAAVSEGRPDLCLVHSATAAINFWWLKRAFPDVPVAMYYHGGEVPNVAPLDDEVVARAFRGADAVFTNTRFSRDHAISRGVPSELIQILKVGFDLDDFRPPEVRSYRRDGILRLLSAGRMSEEKGFIYALQAVERLVERGMDRVHYSLTGEGYSRPQLERYVEEHGLEPYVTFLGTISTGDLHRAMADTDVLLLPSIQVGNWVENQACAVQEAMLWKGLVVVSRTGGVPECVAPELQRFVVGEKDVEGLTDALAAIYEMDDEDLARLGERGRAFVLENFDLDRLNPELLSATVEAAGHATTRSRSQV